MLKASYLKYVGNSYYSMFFAVLLVPFGGNSGACYTDVKFISSSRVWGRLLGKKRVTRI